MGNFFITRQGQIPVYIFRRPCYSSKLLTYVPISPHLCISPLYLLQRRRKVWKSVGQTVRNRWSFHGFWLMRPSVHGNKWHCRLTDGASFDPNPVKTLGQLNSQGGQIGPRLRRSCFSTFIESQKYEFPLKSPLMTKSDEMWRSLLKGAILAHWSDTAKKVPEIESIYFSQHLILLG